MADTYELEQEISEDTLLDDIPELPGFVQLLTGAYVLTCEKGIEIQEIEKNGETSSYYSIAFKVDSVEELGEKPSTEDHTPVPGDTQSFLFDRKHSVAMSNFKKFICNPIAEKFECKSVRQVMEQSRGLQWIIVGKRKYNKDKDQHNFNITKSGLV